MGSRGPAPKRSDQRVRRNKTQTDSVSSPSAGASGAPPLGIEDAHPLVVDWYQALIDSPQSVYFQASDWQTARFVAAEMHLHLTGPKPSSVRFSAIMSAMSNLLVTEADRRRLRIEIENSTPTESAGVTALADYKAALGVV